MTETVNAMKFRLIAALAENIAQMLNTNGAWPGDVKEAKEQISKLLSEIQA